MPEPVTDDISLDAIRDAAKRLAPHIVSTPLLRFRGSADSADIWIKPESLQEIGAFKVRCMANALLTADAQSLSRGAYTASSGNAGLGLAWMAQKLGVPARVYAPAQAPESKLERMRRLGASVQVMPDEAWWTVIQNRRHPDDPGTYVDAVRDRASLAGNGTIGLEIVDQLPQVDTVIVPFGGGGLACGVAAALRALKPDVRVVVAESEAAAPLTAALEAGRPARVSMTPSFISGAGAPCVLPEMWPRICRLIRATKVVTLAEVEDAIRRLAEANRLVAEGAGAVALAAAIAMGKTGGTTVCVVSGGNIELRTLVRILERRRIGVPRER